MWKYIVVLLVVLLICGCSSERVNEQEIESDEDVELLEQSVDISSADENITFEEHKDNGIETEVVETENIDIDSNVSVPDNGDISISITADILNVREQPTIDSDKLGKVYQRNMYKVVDVRMDENSEDWYFIEYSVDEYGWVASWFTELVGAEAYSQYVSIYEKICDNTSVIEKIINLNRKEVVELIGEEDRALWDNIEMEKLYHVYDDYGIAIVYEMNEEYEVTDDSVIIFIDVMDTCEVNGINRFMSSYEIESILGETEHIDYDWWHHDMDQPFHRLKLEYEFPEYSLEVYFDYERGYLREICVLPHLDYSNFINEILVTELFNSSREQILNVYENERVTNEWYYKNYELGLTDDVVIDEWFKLVDLNILVGFSKGENHVMKLFRNYNLDSISYGESLNSISRKLGITNIERILFDNDLYYYYYIIHEAENYRIQLMSHYYPNQDNLMIYLYKRS